METYGFEPIQELPGDSKKTMFLGALLGAIGSALGGAFGGNGQQQQLAYPDLKKNPVLALAMLRSVMGAKQPDVNLPGAPAAVGAPDFASTLARARG